MYGKTEISAAHLNSNQNMTTCIYVVDFRPEGFKSVLQTEVLRYVLSTVV